MGSSTKASYGNDIAAPLQGISIATTDVAQSCINAEQLLQRRSVAVVEAPSQYSGTLTCARAITTWIVPT
jgi:hypothetical protein